MPDRNNQYSLFEPVWLYPHLLTPPLQFPDLSTGFQAPNFNQGLAEQKLDLGVQTPQFIG